MASKVAKFSMIVLKEDWGISSCELVSARPSDFIFFKNPNQKFWKEKHIYLTKYIGELVIILKIIAIYPCAQNNLKNKGQI